MRKLICTTALAAAFAVVGAAQSAEIKVALDSPPNLDRAGSYVWAHAFTEGLKAQGLNAREVPRGAIGGEAEKLDQVSQSLLEVSMSDLKSAGKLDKLIFGVNLPYLFTSVAHLDRTVAAEGLLERVNSVTTKAGVRVLAMVTVGPSSGIFNTRKPVRRVADMSDLRMRALDENQIAMLKAWGSAGIIVSWKEVPNALQTGVADGYLNPVFVPLMFGHTEFIKYFTDAQVTPSIRLVLASADWYRGLSVKDRATVDQAAQRATRINRDWLARVGPKMMDEVKAAGVSVVELSPEARAEFQKRSEQVYVNGVLAPEQVKLWVDAARKHR